MTSFITPKSLHLPYGITISTTSSGTSLSSELHLQLVDAHAEDDAPASAMVHSMEALLLALAAEGVDLSTPAASRALVTAVESAAHYLDAL